MGVKCEKCQHEHENWVPKDRLDTEAAQKRDALEKAKTLEAQMAADKAAVESAKNATAQLAEYQAKEKGWSFERQLLAAGLTDAEGIDFARIAYERLPEKDRPTAADWLKSDSVPRAVRAYLPAQADAAAGKGAAGADASKAAGGDAAKGAGGRAAPTDNKGIVPNTTPTEPFSAEAIERMSPTEYAKNREAILGSLHRGNR